MKIKKIGRTWNIVDAITGYIIEGGFLTYEAARKQLDNILKENQRYER